MNNGDKNNYMGFYRFSPTKLTDNLKKIGEKIGQFFCVEWSANFFVGGEIVWWDTSLRVTQIQVCETCK